MKPYYEQDGITIYHGDCREILPTLTADVLITDPPYGVGLKVKRHRNSQGGGAREVGRASVIYADDPGEIEVLLAEAIPMAIDACDRGLVFPGTRMAPMYPRPKAIGAVWIPAGAGMSSWGFQTSQPIYYYGPDPRLADSLGHFPNGFRSRGKAEQLDHPCPKPLEWMTWAVERASRECETVLDPFMGSGTTLVAAKQLNRNAIGIEIEEHYCEIAAKRLAQGAFDFATAAMDGEG